MLPDSTRWPRSAFAIFCLFWASIFHSIPANAQPRSPVVLFDEGHGMRFVIENNSGLDLSQLADLIRQRGAVVSSSKEKLTRTLLADKKALIISGPFTWYSNGETDDLVNFVIEGGKLAIMLHIPMPVTSVLRRFNILASKGVIQEPGNIIDNNSKYFKIKGLFSHMVTGELQQFSLYGTWALLNIRPSVEVVAETSPRAWMDLNGNNKQDSADPTGPFAVVVAGRLGKGEYLVFGDDAIFQNRYLTGDNKKLAENLADWLLQ